MVTYAESSAIMAWLFNEARRRELQAGLESAELVVTSELTVIECTRAIHRVRSRGLISVSQAENLRAEFEAATTQWDLLEIRDQIVTRASDSFRVEPVRSLDAIHLASIMIAREVWPELTVLSLDERVRANATALGVAVTPASESV